MASLLKHLALSLITTACISHLLNKTLLYLVTLSHCSPACASSAPLLNP